MPGVLLVLTGADVLADGLKPVPHIPAAHEPARHQARQSSTARRIGVERPIPGDRHGALRRRGGGLRRGRDAWRSPRTLPRRCRSTTRTLPPLADIGRGLPGGSIRRPPRPGLRPRAPCRETATEIQRVTGVPMEPRAALGHFDAASRPLHPLCRRRRHRAAQERDRDHPGHRRPSRCGSSPGMSAAISAPATPSIPSSPWLLGVAPHRPAGEMDLRSARGVPERLCRPRFPDRIGAGARRRRQLPRARPKAPAISAPIPPLSCR